MNRTLTAALCLALGAETCLRAQDETRKETPQVEIRGPCVRPGMPDAFALAYEVEPDSVSPDGRFGVIFPNPRSGYENDVIGRNFLVALKPFRILAANEGFAYFGPHGNRQMAVEWTKDGAAALVVIAAKWGTVSATLFELREGRVTRRTDFMAEITKLLAPRFPKGKVEPYNDSMLITITNPDEWKLSKDGQSVLIDIYGNTAPNLAPGKQWSASFKGKWSVPQGKWIETKIKSGIYHNPY